MYISVTVLIVFAYVKDVRSETLCNLETDTRVQYCFDTGYNNGLRRCNTFESEGVIVRPGCGARSSYSNQTYAPRRCIEGNWEDIFTCPSETAKGCTLKSDPSFSYVCFGFDEAPRPCRPYEPNGTVVRPVCNSPLYYAPTPLPLLTCVDGSWDKNVTCLLESQKCILPDGRKGACTLYYYCYNIIDSPVVDIRIRTVNGCASITDVCCDVGDTTTFVPNKPEQQKREGCGWRNIDGVPDPTTGGDHDTEFGEFPWVCAVLEVAPVVNNETDGPKFLYVGGGSLIHPSVVLTAAHYLVKKKKILARAGDWDTETIQEIYPFQDRDVASVVIHEDFNSDNLFYNVAILFLSEPMAWAPNLGVTCLPPPRERTPEGTRCFAIGWRKDKFGMEGRYQAILKKVELPVLENRKCQGRLQQTRLGEYFQLHSSFMCAGGEEGVDACRGEVGAPLACPIENARDRFIQSGIVAWGIGCAKTGVPGVYVDVANLRVWIDDKVEAKGYDPEVYTY